MIKISASFDMNLAPLSGWGDLLSMDSSERKLFGVIKDFAKIRTLTSSFELGRFAKMDGLSLCRRDYYWFVTKTCNQVAKCIGCFYGEHISTDFFIYQLTHPYPRTIDWERCFGDEAFMRRVETTSHPEGYTIEADPASKWFRIESDLPSEFFRSENDVFDKFGYVLGQKIVFEAVKNYIATNVNIAAPPQWGGILLGELGWDNDDISLYEASGYWIVSHSERGKRNFRGIFCTYKEAVDFFLMCLMHPAPPTIDWPRVFHGKP